MWDEIIEVSKTVSKKTILANLNEKSNLWNGKIDILIPFYELPYHNMKSLDPNKIKIDEKSYKNVLIYHIGCVTDLAAQQLLV